MTAPESSAPSSASLPAASSRDKAIVGRHVLLDLRGVRAHGFEDAASILAWLSAALAHSGFHVLGTTSHSFQPYGATGVVLLSESHASFHTYPEHRYVAFDVFGCGDADIDRLVTMVQAYWDPEQVSRNELQRGT